MTPSSDPKASSRSQDQEAAARADLDQAEVEELDRRLAAVKAERDNLAAHHAAHAARRSVRAAVWAGDQVGARLDRARRWSDLLRPRRPGRLDRAGRADGTAAIEWEPPPARPATPGSAGAEPALVSVIMAAYNRADRIGPAIESVLSQSHTAWELIIVDDGSTDDTPAIIERYRVDRRSRGRIRVLTVANGGAARARNRGLTDATGRYCAYLDTDNLWSPWFLEAVVGELERCGADAGYADLVAHTEPLDPADPPLYRLGREFDWERCRESNFVDLNVLVHRRRLPGAWFDPDLARNEDWDLVLRLGRHGTMVHVPFVGCRYRAAPDPDRVSVGRADAFSRIVQLLHTPATGGDGGESGPEHGDRRVAALDPDRLELRVDVVISPPFDDRRSWGDYHLARDLVVSLAHHGHRGRVVFRDSSRPPANACDVNLVLRGDHRYRPAPGAVNVLWVICDPETVEPDEIEEFDLVFVASTSFAALLNAVPGLSVEALLQGSNLTPADESNQLVPDLADRGLFVGNSRLDHRPVVEDAAALDPDLVVFGRQWEGTVVEPRVVAPLVERRLLPALYAGARYVVNDHWPSMIDFGIISNRLFDVLAVGGRPISDRLAELAQEFPSVPQVDDREDLALLLTADWPTMESEARIDDIERAASSLDDRARALDRAVKRHLGLTVPSSPAPPSGRAMDALAVSLSLAVDPASADWAARLAFVALVCPLTAGANGTLLALRTAQEPGDEPRLVITVDQPGAGRRRIGVRLAPDWPEPAGVDELWDLEPGTDHPRVPVSIDPRLWRRYHRRRAPAGGINGVGGADGAGTPRRVVALDGLGMLATGAAAPNDPAHRLADASVVEVDRLVVPGLDAYRLARMVRAAGPFDRAVAGADPGSWLFDHETLVAQALRGDAIWWKHGAASVGRVLANRLRATTSPPVEAATSIDNIYHK